MKRNKYINSFDTTTEFENYIESAAPGFPNVALTKDDGEIHYTRTSPNSYVIYGTLNDNTISPTLNLIDGSSIIKTYNFTVDQLNNTYYLDDWGTLPNFNTLNEYSFFYGLKNKVTSLKKFYIDTSSVTNMRNLFKDCSSLTSVDLSSLDTSSVTNMYQMFYGCSSLTSLDLSSLNTSNVTTIEQMFRACSSLTTLNLTNCDFSSVTNKSYVFLSVGNLIDVYITVESTLMKLTNNLSSQGQDYIPSTATIHYNGTDYKWQNNAWTAQS